MHIKFYDKDEPTRIAKTVNWLIFIGAIPIALKFFLLSLTNGLPINMLVVWFEFMPDTRVIILISLVILLTGWGLSKHKRWLNGKLELTGNTIEITAEEKISISFESLNELYGFRKNPNRMRIKSVLYNNLIIDFEIQSDQEAIMEKLKEVI